MNLIGTDTIGSIRFIFTFEKYLDNVFWVKNKKFQKILSDKNVLKNWKSAKPKLIITGTSIGLKIDKKLLIYARNNNIKSVTVIDSWVELEHRIKYKKKFYLANIILVIEKKIKDELVNLGVNKSIIRIVGNPILENIKNIRNLIYRNTEEKRILFISQPFSETEKKFNLKNSYNEFQSLLDIIKIFNKKKEFKIFVKMHFEDKNNKYSYFKKKYQINILKNSNEVDYSDIVQNYLVIIGINSFLLKELNILHNNVFSYISKNIDNSGNTKNIKKIRNIKDIFKKISYDNVIRKKNKKFKLNSQKKILNILNEIL